MHQPCQRCKYTTSVDIQKPVLKIKLVTHVESHASAVSARERRIALYKSDQQQQQHLLMELPGSTKREGIQSRPSEAHGGIAE